MRKLSYGSDNIIVYAVMMSSGCQAKNERSRRFSMKRMRSNQAAIKLCIAAIVSAISSVMLMKKVRSESATGSQTGRRQNFV